MSTASTAVDTTDTTWFKGESLFISLLPITEKVCLFATQSPKEKKRPKPEILDVYIRTYIHTYIYRDSQNPSLLEVIRKNGQWMALKMVTL